MALKAARSLVGVVAGYGVMVVLLTLVQEVLFGGVSFHRSSAAELLGAGLLSVASAAIGGLVAAAIAGRAFRAHAIAMAALVVLETTALIATGGLTGPLWFDVLAAASLMVGIVAGAEAFSMLSVRLGRTSGGHAGRAKHHHDVSPQKDG